MGSIPAVVLVLLVLGATFQVRGANIVNIENFDSSELNRILSLLETSNSASLGILYNRGLDVVFDFLNKETVKQGRSEVKLPDFQEYVRKKVGFVKVKGQFVANQGSLTDLASVRRTGDVKVARTGNGYAVTVQLGLGAVRVRYGHCRAKLGRRGPSVSGRIDGHVGSNAIRATATVAVKDGACSVVLDELKVVQLEGLKVKVSGSGFGPLNWLISTITTSFAKKNRGQIMSKIEEGLAKAARKSLSKIHCNLNALG